MQRLVWIAKQSKMTATNNLICRVKMKIPETLKVQKVILSESLTLFVNLAKQIFPIML